MSGWRAQKNPAHGRAFGFFGSTGAIVELYADHDRALSASRLMSAFTKIGRRWATWQFAGEQLHLRYKQ